MTPEQWQRLKAVFDGAVAQPPDTRRDWLRQACGSDASLLAEAEALLAAHETAGQFLEQPADLDDADLDTLAEGTMLGSYRIVREIGRGGMGIVYLAEDNLGRAVALKTLPPFLAAQQQLRERLRREARAAATINHPAVATVYVFDEVDGHLIIVSEYVRGETLRAVLGRGAVETAQAFSMAVEIAGALAAAHEAQVIHRDLKPENVIVTPQGRIKVVDFGIAHIEIPEPTKLTVPGMMLGTPAYMAPEQLLGRRVTPAADVYAFGVVFTEMLTGRHPLAANRRPAAVGDAERFLPFGERIPGEFSALIERCLRIDPDERFASGRELLAALEVTAAAGRTPAPGVGEPGSANARPMPAGKARPADAPRTAVGSPRWWWEFHQAMAAGVYWVMLWPEWIGRGIIGGRTGRALFIATLVAVIAAANLRLHLWFTSRFYPGELRWARRRGGAWIRAADWLFVVSLAATGVLVGEDRSPVAIVLVAVAVGAAIAFLVIERATARAAFRTSTKGLAQTMEH